MMEAPQNDYTIYFPQTAPERDVSRKRLSKLLQMYGYIACQESLVILEDHFSSSNQYEDLVDFISKLNNVIKFETKNQSPIINPDLAYLVIQQLKKIKINTHTTDPGISTNDEAGTSTEPILVELTDIPENPLVRLKNVTIDDFKDHDNRLKLLKDFYSDGFNKVDFKIQYNFLLNRLTNLPIFSGDFKIVKLSTLTASTQPSIRCICFGLLTKDLSKIDSYKLTDSSGEVPLKINPETIFRNRLAYSNCIVLVEGVYINPDDVLYAANIGLPPILLDALPSKHLACKTNKLVIILKEIYLDDDDICRALTQLFDGYNSMEDEFPLLFIMIGDFIRHPCTGEDKNRLIRHMKKLVTIISRCDNLKQSHFIIVPGPNDTTSRVPMETTPTQASKIMPKYSMDEDDACIKLWQASGYNNVHLATNPCHIYVGERLLTIISHSYLKVIRKNLLHDLSDHNEEFFDTIQKIILSNAHLTSGISKRYHSSMNLWHRPDLLILADTEAVGKRYDWNSSKESDTSFATVPSFSRQSNEFTVYCMKSGEVEPSSLS